MSTMLKQSLTDAMKAALRAGDKPRLGAVRLALAEIKRAELDQRGKATKDSKTGKDGKNGKNGKDGKDGKEADDAQVTAVLDRMVKQRRESIKQYEAGGRAELAAAEAAEIKVLQEFLPAQLEAEALQAIIDKAIASASAAATAATAKDGTAEVKGPEAMRLMGKVMAAVKPQVAGRADMAQVSRLVKEALS